MSRGRVPNVNASLLHELRMVIQQFIGGRQENYYSMRIAEARAKAQPAPTLKCSFCVGVPADAVFIVNGHSVCARHKTQAQTA